LHKILPQRLVLVVEVLVSHDEIDLLLGERLPLESLFCNLTLLYLLDLF
jgi:hypothetical protein